MRPALPLPTDRPPVQHGRRRCWRRRRAMALVWGMVTMLALCAVVSLAVDLGRVQLAKTELRRTADAAARYATTGLADESYLTRAQQVAAENPVDGATVTLLPSDVTAGNWDATKSPKFSAARTPVNAVRVSPKRVAARGTGVPTMFMKLLGMHTCDVTASAIATSAGARSFGFIGLQSVDVNSGLVDSYDARLGAYGGANTGESGALASNGPVSLHSSTVLRDVYMRPGETLHAGSSSYGTRQTGGMMSFPTPSAGAYATTNDNAAVTPAGVVSGGEFKATDANVTIPAGNYYFNKFELKGGTVNVTGPATIYVNGDIHVHSTPVLSVASPGDLTFKVVAPGASVHFNSVDSFEIGRAHV